MLMDSRLGAPVVNEAGIRHSRAVGSKKAQVRTVAQRFVCCNLRPTIGGRFRTTQVANGVGICFESVGPAVVVAPLVRRHPLLIANSGVMPRSDARLGGDTADHVEAKKRRNATASDSGHGKSRGVLRPTLTEPETVPMTPEQHRQAVAALSAMISNWLRHQAGRSAQGPE